MVASPLSPPNVFCCCVVSDVVAVQNPSLLLTRLPDLSRRVGDRISGWQEEASRWAQAPALPAEEVLPVVVGSNRRLAQAVVAAAAAAAGWQRVRANHKH